MHNEAMPSNAKAQLNQKRNLVLIISVMAIAAFILMGIYFIKLKSQVRQTKQNHVETIKVSALGSDINDSSIALQRIEKKMSDYEQRLNKQEVEHTKNENEDLNGKDKVIESFEEKIKALEQTIQALQAPSDEIVAQVRSDTPAWHEQKQSPSTAASVFPNDFEAGDFQKVAYMAPIETSQQMVAVPASISIESFKQTASKSKKSSNYIPAGTYVKALLIQGIDASAAVSSQADPRPVLMRLVSNGSLPNEVSTHIEDCRIIGAAYGDVSSERAFVRLESMSCTLKSKDIIESLVDGYVVGEDGKAGIRGTVVRREKDLLTNSFMSGLASGFGSGLSDSFDRDLVSPLGVVRETKGSDAFKKAGAEGIGNSFDRLSRYYIERAEQFQPVIQVGAGREVDVVFKKGFHLHDGQQVLVLAQDE